MIIQLNLGEQTAQNLGLTRMQLRRATVLMTSSGDEDLKQAIAEYIEALADCRDFLEPLFDSIVDLDHEALWKAAEQFGAIQERLEATFTTVNAFPVRDVDQRTSFIERHVDLTEDLNRMPTLLHASAKRFEILAPLHR